MFSEFFRSKVIAIDLGTAKTQIHVCGQGIVLEEPSVVAIRFDEWASGKKTLQAVGLQAKAMLGKVPGYLKAVPPLKDGVIADLALTELMLKKFIRRVHPWWSIFRSPPRIVICVPCGSTQVERSAIRESALAAGAKEVFLLEEAMAAGIGAGLPVNEATGSMVVDLGGGTTEVAIITLGGMIYKVSVTVGGDKLDVAIMAYVRRNHGVLIGEQTTENIKKTVGSTFPSKQVLEMQVHGRNIAIGVPRSFRISSKEILEALSEPLVQIIQAVRNGLENTPSNWGPTLPTRAWC